MRTRQTSGLLLEVVPAKAVGLLGGELVVESDWRRATIAELCEHIVSVHHVLFPRVGALAGVANNQPGAAIFEQRRCIKSRRWHPWPR